MFEHLVLSESAGQPSCEHRVFFVEVKSNRCSERSLSSGLKIYA